MSAPALYRYGYFLENWAPLLLSIVVLVAAIILGMLTGWICVQISKIILVRRQPIYMSLFNKYWRKPIFAIWIFIFLYCSSSLVIFSPAVTQYYDYILSLLLIALLSRITIQFVCTLRDIIGGKRGLQITDNDSLYVRRTNTLINILTKIVIVVIYVIGLAASLMLFPKIQRIGLSILASAGVVGVMLGFAAQKSLSNILSGIQIAFTQPIKLGDVVTIEGETGTVEEINFTYVVIENWDKRSFMVPINFFIEKAFYNWTNKNFDVLGTVNVDVNYIAELKPVRAALRDILHQTDLWDGRVQRIEVFDTKSIVVTLRIVISAANPITMQNLRCFVREKIIMFLQQNHPDYLPKTAVLHDVTLTPELY